jgi:ATP-binding cassette subfamily B protein
LGIDLIKNSNTLKNIISLWKYLGKNRKTKFFLLISLMILSVFTEIISIGAIIPFLSALTNPDILMKLDWFQPIINLLNIKSSDELLFPLTLGFIGASVFAALIRILLLWLNTRLSADMGIQLRNDVYTKTLYQPYSFHIAHNSSQLISMVTEKVGIAIHAGILHVLMLISSTITSFSIIITLLIVNPIVALSAFVTLGGGYILIGYLVRKKIKDNGDIISKNQPEAVKCMQEGLGGIRDIILDSSQNVFTELYSKVATNIQLAGMRNSFLAGLPKSLLEVLSITLIAILAYALQMGDNKEQQVLPLLGALALGAQRLLPALQQIYFSWSTINGYQSIIEDVVSQLPKETINKIDNKSVIKPLAFEKDILLENIKFKYQNTDNYVLKNISLKIKKGSKIGFIGKTGSGKTTLLDIIMGLFYPSQGEIKVDGIKIDKNNIANWQANIAHVPQSIFLTDASMAENIAFGIPMDKIDMQKVKEAAKQASLHDFIEELPDGYKTSVGERGVQLSGGQRQRIGIARALYKEASIIIFDEATSALDNETEISVMEAINSLDKNLTILIIAHRLSTLEDCDTIYKLDNGYIVENGTYDEIIQKTYHEK